MQQGTQGLHWRLRDSLRTGITFEYCQGSRPRRINKHLRKFGKLDYQQGMDLIFVTHDVVAELVVNAQQFAIRRDLFARHVAKACLSAEQRSRNGEGVELICFRSHASLLRKSMHLRRMQQAYLIASLKQGLEEILAIAGGCFQANQHLLRGDPEIV